MLVRREVLGRFLTQAGLQPTEEEQLRIDTCEDPATLDRWIYRSIGASSVEAALR